MGSFNNKGDVPQQGWFLFYQEFEYAFIDWLLAGCCTEHCCILSLHGCIYDVTAFLPLHPGSLESLMWGAGCESSENFEEIGHSSYAKAVVQDYIIWNTNRSTDVASKPLLNYEQNKKTRKALMKLTKFQRQLKIERGVALRQAFKYIKGINVNDEYIGDDFNCDDCIRLQVHSGQPKMYYSPLSQTHHCWFTCCGYVKQIVI